MLKSSSEEILYSLPCDPIYKSFNISSYNSTHGFTHYKEYKPNTKPHLVKSKRANNSDACSIPSIPHNKRKFGYYETITGMLYPLEDFVGYVREKSVYEFMHVDWAWRL